MFIKYLKSRYKILLLLLCGAVVNGIVFYLYSLPIQAVLYPVILITVILFCIGIVDFFRFALKLDKLKNMKDTIRYSLDGLPSVTDSIEAGYVELLMSLNDEKMLIISQTDAFKSDMTDYYTLWAHQIKTPIAAMRLLLQCEKNERNDDLELELFKIEQYVEMVLQYLRLDSKSSDYVIRQYRIDDIIKQALRKYSKLFILKKISLEYSDSGILALTDEKWLLFVIEQILSNSLKYTEKGSISIYTENDNTLVIRDNGIGISAEDLPRVTEKGYTGYNGRNDKKSTGIGLYLSKRILDKLGHGFYIQSTVGKGTVVKICLESADTVLE